MDNFNKNKIQNIIEQLNLKTEDDLVPAVIEGEISYKEFEQIFPNKTAAAIFYSNHTSFLYQVENTNNSGLCEVCNSNGKRIRIQWTGEVAKSIPHWLIGIIVGFSALGTAMLGVPISKAGTPSGTKLFKFETNHLLCSHCRPLTSRKLLAFFFNFFSSILVLMAIIIFMVSGSLMTSALLRAFDLTINDAINSTPWFAVSTLILTMAIKGYFRRLELMILLPYHLRKIARGPFKQCSLNPKSFTLSNQQ